MRIRLPRRQRPSVVHSNACRLAIVVMAVALAGLPATLAAAGVYKWRDADGKLHFSDSPPVELPAEKIEVNTARDKYTEQRLKNLRRAADDIGRPDGQAAEPTAEEAKAAEVAAHCQQARDKLTELMTSTRRQVVNEAGELEFLGEEQRQAWIKDAQAEITKHCK